MAEVVGVMVEKPDGLWCETTHDLVYDGRLPGSDTAREADQEGVTAGRRST